MDGVKAARELRPTLILLDLGLPDLDGTLVAQQIRQFLKPEETLICAFTAQTGDKAKRLAHAYGCQQFISKPISTRIFPEQVMEMLKSIQSSVPADSAKPS
jgi:DNA-binding response OmpR family regulator